MKHGKRRVCAALLVGALILSLFSFPASAQFPQKAISSIKQYRTLGSLAIGDIVKLNENDIPTDYIVVNQGNPNPAQYAASCDDTWLLRKDIAENQMWYGTNNYSGSGIHAYLQNTFILRYDIGIKNAIKQVQIPYIVRDNYIMKPYYGSSGVSAKLFLLSVSELGIKEPVDRFPPVYATTLSYFTDTPPGNEWHPNLKRTAMFNGVYSEWWLRDPSSYRLEDGMYSMTAISSGLMTSRATNESYGIRPAMIMPQNLLVKSDGQLCSGTPPTPPISIVPPNKIDAGTNVTVSWASASDPDNNLAGYVAERSTDGGNTWSTVYQGIDTNTTTIVERVVSQVMFRVKAYDAEGLESGYTVSSNVLVSPATATTLGSIAVGDIVYLNEFGAPVEYIVVHQGLPDYHDETCNGTWLLRKNISENRVFDSNREQYFGLEMGPYLSEEWIQRLDQGVINELQGAKIDGTDAWKIFLLSYYEVGGFWYDAGYGDVTYPGAPIGKLAYFKQSTESTMHVPTANAHRIAYFGNGSAVVASDWWLRSYYRAAYPAGYGQIIIADSTGFIWKQTGPNQSLGVRPACILPPSTVVNQNNIVVGNTAPTVPAGISIPNYIEGNTTITMTWGPATDTENNLDGYVVERSINKGTSWEQIYKGPATNTANKIAQGTSTVTYRVKAYDSAGLESGYATSADISVTNLADYRVQYYGQDVTGPDYTILSQDTKRGVVGTSAKATDKSFPGYHENISHKDRVPNGTVTLDGSLTLKLYFNRNLHTVSFDSSGGAIIPEQTGIRYGATVAEPIPPTRQGYDFAAWQNAGAAYDFSTPVIEDLTLTATWTPRNDTPYTVAHYQQNVTGTGYTLKDTDNLSGTTDTTVTASTKTYDGFHELTTHADRVPSGNIAPDGSLYLKLYYERDTYTVTFDSTGGNSVPSQNGIRHGAAAVEPISPTKQGYDFSGWKSAGSAYDFSTPVIEDLTLTATWTPRNDTPYTVAHYQQDVTGTGYTLKDTDTLAGTTDAIVAASAKNYDGFHELTTHADRVPSGSIAPDGSLRLKLYYERLTVTVTFDTGGGSAVDAQSSIRFEGVATEPPAPTKMGYDFAGWYADESCTILYDFITPVTHDITIYARWLPRGDIGYHVEHYLQTVVGDSYILTATEVLEGITDALVSAVPQEYTGFEETPTHPDRVASGTVAADGALTLRLYYDRLHYTVTLDPNGGACEVKQLAAIYGGVYGPLPTPQRPDYEFAGWYTQADGGVRVMPEAITGAIGNCTLYAQWMEDKYGAIDGVVTDPDGNPVAGAMITVRAGNVDYRTTTTDQEGRFAVLNVKYGTYNLIAEKDGVIVTTFFELKEAQITRVLVLPQGKTNSVVVVEEGTPEIVVGGLDSLFGAQEVYSEKDAATVSAGGMVELKMHIAQKAPADIPTEQQKITQATTKLVAIYLDISIAKEVTEYQSDDTSSDLLLEVPELMTLYLPLDAQAKGKNDYTVFRTHDDAVDEITETPNDYGEYIEIQSDRIILYTRRFSTYALAYNEPSERSSYVIHAVAGPGGSVSPEQAEVYRNSGAEFTITPDAGHQIADVLVDNVSVGAVDTYRFRNVTANHTVEAQFRCPSSIFSDLDAELWYHRPVDFMLAHEYMEGTEPRVFQPDAPLTRSMAVTILARMSGAELGTVTAPPFPDVSPDVWYAPAAAWAAESRTIVGFDTGYFAGDTVITREQLALILYRAAGSPAVKGGEFEAFPDRAEVSPWASTAVRWAVSVGLLEGNEHSLLMPRGTVTRAEAAAMFQRSSTLK